MISRKTLARTFMITALFLLLANCAGAVPVEEWNRTFGGAYWDEAHSIQQTPDKGYIIAGSTNIKTDLNGRSDYGDAWLIKTDADGHEQWNRTYAGKRVKKVSTTSDGDYILRGLSDWDFWLMKTDDNGLEQWNKTFSVNNNFTIISVEETSDGGSILTGGDLIALSEPHVTWNTRLIKVDASGNEQWNMTSKRLQGFFASSVQQTSDGGYILAGTTESGEFNGDALIIKTDVNGNQQWDKTFGGPGWNGAGWDEANSVQQTSDRGYVLAGSTSSYGVGDYNAWLIKTDASGNEQWKRAFGESEDDFGSSVQQTSDGGYIFAGYTNINGAGDIHAWLIKTDANGNQKWKKVFAGAKMDKAYTVQQTSDRGYILAGYIEPYVAGHKDAWLVKIKETNADERSIPGFEILGAMVSVVILFLLMRERT